MDAGALALGLLLLGALPAAWLAGLTGLSTAALLAVGAWELTVGLARRPDEACACRPAAPGLPPRPERFGKTPRGQLAALRPLPLDGQTLGVGTPATFTWQQLLSFDACVQCGKCEATCPAFAAGQPLNPRS